MRSSRQPPRAGEVTDRQLQTLLTRYGCPMPLHAVRLLFLGAIASPRQEVSPMNLLTQAWGGGFPSLESTEAAEELIGALIDGLWNRLARHHSARDPFRLPRLEVAASRPALKALAEQRAEELLAFADGLFGDEEALEFPEKAARALDILAELFGFFAGAADLLADESSPAPDAELAALLRNLSKMTIIADEEINRIIQSCKRARVHQVETIVVPRPEVFALDTDDPGEDGDEDEDEDDDQWEDDGPEIIHSPLEQTLSRNGVTVLVDIYRTEQTGWILEVIDAEGTSHIWKEEFETDREAFDEAVRALEEEPLQFTGGGGDDGVN